MKKVVLILGVILILLIGILAGCIQKKEIEEEKPKTVKIQEREPQTIKEDEQKTVAPEIIETEVEPEKTVPPTPSPVQVLWKINLPKISETEKVKRITASQQAVYIQKKGEHLKAWIYALSPQDGSVKWTYAYRLGISGDNFLFARPELVFVQDNDGLTALDSANGNLKWKKTGVIGFWTPNLETTKERVYFSYLGDLSSVDAQTGKEIWKKKGGYGPLVLQEDTLYVLQIRGYYGMTIAKAIEALEPSTGNLKWRYEFDLEQKVSPTALAINEQGLYGAMRNPQAIFSLDPITGSLKWQKQIDFDSSSIYLQVRLQTAEETILALIKDEARPYDMTNIYAIEASTGEIRWNLTNVDMAPFSDYEVANPQVFYTFNRFKDKQVNILDTQTGKEILNYRLPKKAYLAAISDGILYVYLERSIELRAYSIDKPEVEPFTLTIRVKQQTYGKGEIKELDLEKEYLPAVLASENPYAPYESSKAQVAAARSYALYKKLVEPRSKDYDILDSEADQVFNPNVDITSLHRRAVKDTESIVLKYNGNIASAFYVSGTGSTEKYVTYNKGKSGNEITQTSLGWVTDPPSKNPYNRGCMGQIQANELANQGYNWQEILRYFYGEDIKIVRWGEE